MNGAGHLYQRKTANVRRSAVLKAFHATEKPGMFKFGDEIGTEFGADFGDGIGTEFAST